MKDNIVILTSTQYHVLLAISIIEEYFGDRDKYNVILIKSNKGAVEDTIVNTGGNYSIRHLNIQQKGLNLVPETITAIKELTAMPVKQFLFFNEDYLVALYMALSLKKRGTIVGLVQDGLKGYAIVNKSALKYRLLRTIEFYKFLKANGLKLGSFYFVNIKYGQSSAVDELWLTHPESTVLSTKPIRKINFLSNAAQLEDANKTFSFTDKDLPSDNVIFLISSIVKESDKVCEVEKKLVEDLQQKYPDAKTYIKVHPRIPEKTLRMMKEFKNTVIIENPAPAELYIAKLDKAIVIASFSTSLLYDNDKSKYYWAYPMYQKHLKNLSYTKLINPTTHIKVVDTVNDIVF